MDYNEEIHFTDNVTARGNLYYSGKAMKTRNIIGIILWFTVIGAFASLIISLIDSIYILSTDFRNKELNNTKLLWGLLSLLLIGNIGCLVFANKMMSAADYGKPTDFTDNKEQI
ncbi:MAG: hypothetical protein ACRDCH_02440 [Metamycoplasmataceae bacterium]